MIRRRSSCPERSQRDGGLGAGHRARGGDKGGDVVAEGTPEQVAQVPGSCTGGYPNPLL